MVRWLAMIMTAVRKVLHAGGLRSRLVGALKFGPEAPGGMSKGVRRRSGWSVERIAPWLAASGYFD
jgi:hypothetical protein